MINAHGCLAARVAALIGGVKGRIYTRHCYYTLPKYMKKFPIRQMVGVANTLLSSRVIAVADAAKENLTDMGISEERVSVIINGVEGLRKYSAEERARERRALGIEGRFCVGICARIEDCKGHDTFLRAARILLGRSDKYRFLIVGDGSERSRTEALASALGIRDKVIFTGFCRDVERYFNCMDVNVNCSRGTETSSLALSEGMSIGLPAVVSDYGGNAYMVRDGENGFVYGTGDFFTLAEKTERLASDVGLYRRMSEQAYDRYLSELNSKNMTEQTERLYRQIYEERVESARR
jgi:glycosyltransferase involved in cell wall biosynthesis